MGISSKELYLNQIQVYYQFNYLQNNMSEKPIVSWPARKQLLGDLLFFCVYNIGDAPAEKPKTNDWNWEPEETLKHLVVYANSIPVTSAYIELISSFFPTFEFIVFNSGEMQTNQEFDPWALGGNNTTFLSEQYTSKYVFPRGVSFFLSDLPESSEWIQSIRPIHACLDFGDYWLSEKTAKTIPDLKGTLYWSVWSASGAESARLVPLQDTSGEYIRDPRDSAQYLEAQQKHHKTRLYTTYKNPYAYDKELVDDYDSSAEAKILQVYFENFLNRSPTVDDIIEMSQNITLSLRTTDFPNLSTLRNNSVSIPFILKLEEALITRDFPQISELMSSEEFVLDNTRYRWTSKNAFFFRERLHNDSGLLMRAAVGSGCYGIVKLILLEESVNHSAMDNIALQDALISNKKDIVELLAAAKTIRCPKIYNTAPTPWTIYEIFRQGLDIFASKYYKVYDTPSKQLVKDSIFVKHYTSELPKTSVVRNTQFHRALLATYRDTEKEVYYRMLCECSSLRERQNKHLWSTTQ